MAQTKYTVKRVCSKCGELRTTHPSGRSDWKNLNDTWPVKHDGPTAQCKGEGTITCTVIGKE